MVTGAEIPLRDLSELEVGKVPTTQIKGYQFSEMDNEVQKLLKMKVIEKCESEDGEIISPVFLVMKPDGTYRMILNLKEFNQSVTYEHFKMENLTSAIRLMRKGCYMASVDLRHAYYSVSIKPDFRKFLKFIWREQLYEYTCFPNGLCNCPRYFTKLLKPVYACLRKRGFLSASFIDDCYLQGQTYESCLQNVQETVHLFEALGFIIHEEKSELTPLKKIKYLGFWLDSENMSVCLTEEKIQKLKNTCRSVKNRKRITIRELAQVIGQLVASFPAVLWGQLFYRQLDKVKVEALKVKKGDFDALVVISKEAEEELDWWLQNIDSAFFPIERSEPEMVITTDASTLGWGAVCHPKQTGGRWSVLERNNNINVLELMAIEHALKSFSKDIDGKHIKVLTDNSCAVSYIEKMGGSHSADCNDVAKRIWIWCKDRNIWLTVAHIPGKLNTQADARSRKFNDNTEWMLDRQIFKRICELVGKPEIDLFASRLNRQLATFVSWQPDPESFAVDAFKMSWTNWFFYAFPPFSLIQRVLVKLEKDNAEGVVIVPDWPTATWYPQLLRLLVRKPLLLPKGRTVLRLAHAQTPHPLHSKLQLMAVMLSGMQLKHKEFMDKLAASSVHHGGKGHTDSIPATCHGGKFSVLNGTVIHFMHL